MYFYLILRMWNTYIIAHLGYNFLFHQISGENLARSFSEGRVNYLESTILTRETKSKWISLSESM